MNLLQRIIQLSKTTNIVGIIAATVCVFFAFTSFIFINHTRQMEEMSRVVQQNLQSSQKMQLLSEQMELARARTRLSAQIISTDDPFEQDELNTELESYASRFANNRQAFLDLNLIPEEQQVIEKQDSIVPVILPAQRKVVELAMYGDKADKAEAQRLLYETVMPGQGQLIELFAQLIQFEQEQIDRLAQETTQTVQATHAQHNTFALLALFVALPIATLVIYRVRRIQKANEQAHGQLELAVTERTEELERAREMLQTVLDTIPVRVFWKNRGGEYLGCNTLFAKDAGLESAEEILGKRDDDMPWREHAMRYRQDDLEVMNLNQPKLNFEAERTSPEGETIWLEANKIPLTDSLNKSIGILGSYQEITERKHQQQKLEHMLEEVRSANQAKSEFLSSMSHELRTPLNAIMGFSQLLEGEENLTLDQKESVHDIIRAGHHLLELINEVLDLAKIEAGKLELSIERVPLKDMMQACQTLISPMAEQHHITVNIEQSCLSEHCLKADYVRTKQVLLNLLSNAIKYNRSRGSVTVRCHKSEERLRIEVHDTGTGIPADKLDKLFEAFNRLGAESSTIEGTGIGLLITRQLVQMMEGEMGVDSRAGEGSCFWFELPTLPPLKERPATTKKLEENSDIKTITGQHKVLYIEDNPVNLKLVQKLIAKQTELELIPAEEPIGGIALAKQELPDLILLDINLPQMSGYEVIRHLRECDETRDIPVIALTANAMADDMSRGEEAGFDDYLTKPLQIKSFFEVLHRHLNN